MSGPIDFVELDADSYEYGRVEQIAPNVRVTVLRETITGVYVPTPANDIKPAAKAS